MRTKFRLTALLATIMILMLSCKKDSSNPTPIPAPSKMETLTANVWIYDSVYINWGQANQTVTYARNSTNNLRDYSLDRVKFYSDGTFNEILETGNLRQGLDTWTMNSDSTLISTTGGGYTNIGKIIVLTSSKYISIDTVTNVRIVNIPKN
jgi:hypothetical protein